MENKFKVNDWLPENMKSIKMEDRRPETAPPPPPQRGGSFKALPVSPGGDLPACLSGREGAVRLSTQTDTTVETDIDRVVAAIEKGHIDLTSDYKDWLTLGFAFAHELGEMGRSYFQRTSKFYPGYDAAKTDKQYDSCLKGKNDKVTIKSFFYLAKQAIAPSKPPPQGEASKLPPHRGEGEGAEGLEGANCFNTPVLPDEIYAGLPGILTDCCSFFKEGIEKDIVLLSSLTILSGCLPNIEGTYFNRNLSPHLYLFVTGPSASGKGSMIWSRYLAQAIHEDKYLNSCKEHEDYLKELEAWESLTGKQKKTTEKPVQPFRKMLFLPANSSSAAFTQLLSENNFTGIIFESEADTLSNAAKQDWGDSSDIFRKAFHHENTSMARRLNKEIIEITNPHLSICLSGTPKQVINLMPEVENGLFSRFMYYAFEDSRGFLNPFISHKSDNYEQFFRKTGYEVFHFYDRLSKRSAPIIFRLSKEQGDKFTQYFQNLLDKNKMLLSRDLDANTKRLGVITFRIAMVLSALRLMEIEPGTPYPAILNCSDLDFETALTIATTLESHAVAVYQHMPKNLMKGLRLAFFEKLPVKFSRKQYVNIAQELGIAERTADKYIGIFKNKLLEHQYNEYNKIKNMQV